MKKKTCNKCNQRKSADWFVQTQIIGYVENGMSDGLHDVCNACLFSDQIRLGSEQVSAGEFSDSPPDLEADQQLVDKLDAVEPMAYAVFCKENDLDDYKVFVYKEDAEDYASSEEINEIIPLYPGRELII